MPLILGPPFNLSPGDADKLFGPQLPPAPSVPPNAPIHPKWGPGSNGDWVGINTTVPGEWVIEDLDGPSQVDIGGPKTNPDDRLSGGGPFSLGSIDGGNWLSINGQAQFMPTILQDVFFRTGSWDAPTPSTANVPALAVLAKGQSVTDLENQFRNVLSTTIGSKVVVWPSARDGRTTAAYQMHYFSIMPYAIMAHLPKLFARAKTQAARGGYDVRAVCACIIGVIGFELLRWSNTSISIGYSAGAANVDVYNGHGDWVTAATNPLVAGIATTDTVALTVPA